MLSLPGDLHFLMVTNTVSEDVDLQDKQTQVDGEALQDAPRLAEDETWGEGASLLSLLQWFLRWV